MNIIFYWKKSYFKDEYPLRELILYTNYPSLNIIFPGETMWIVTKYGCTYVLVGKFIILPQQKCKPNLIHGNFCIYGDKNKSVFYDLDDPKQKDFRSDLQKLRPNWTKDEIGIYFRAKRHIMELGITEQQKIELFSKTLKII